MAPAPTFRLFVISEYLDVNRYRMYVDESGTNDLKNCDDDRYRYLGLTGVILPLGAHDTLATGTLEKLKGDHIPSHRLDRPVILVRQDIIHARGPFHVLTDPDRCAAWERDILKLLQRWAQNPITVVVDKPLSRDRYGDQDEEPYQKAMRLMLERYLGWLRYKGVGDVMCEVRGEPQDRQLRRAYEWIYRLGTSYRGADEFQAVLTSGKLKIQPKTRNVAGLQIADLIANPANRSLFQDYRGRPRELGTFTQTVIDTIRPFYHPKNRVLIPKK